MSQFSSEENVIVASWVYLTIGHSMPALPPTFDWQKVLTLAASHHVTPILEYALDAAQVPPLIWQKIGQKSRQRRIRNTVMLADFATICQQLENAGIPLIPLKGIAHAAHLYPSPTLRYFDDIDLLVPANKIDAALQELKSLGYIPHPRVQRPDWHHLLPYTHPAHGTTIELHTDVVRRVKKGWGIAGIWDRAQKSSQNGNLIWQMSAEDALIHTAIHARHHLFNRPSFLLDGALLCRHIEDWQPLKLLAKEAGGLKALRHLLFTCMSMGLVLAEEMPAGFTQPVRAAIKINGWRTLKPQSAPLQIGTLPKLVELLLLDSWQDGWANVKALLLPQKTFLESSYQAKSKRTPLPLLRILHRSQLALRQLKSLLFNS